LMLINNLFISKCTDAVSKDHEAPKPKVLVKVLVLMEVIDLD